MMSLFEAVFFLWSFLLFSIVGCGQTERKLQRKPCLERNVKKETFIDRPKWDEQLPNIIEEDPSVVEKVKQSSTRESDVEL
ncbi:unnamed protein product [Caenorhabditis auriculariae]|uniref:Uncharacterized protein n=1 Tax=Caenorhabditis auriculariae TaxID=2777116 RepID=A0A8S1H8G0_9PELO|nr:unnamed protein product [Caenorhabditis auriculariae]